MTGIFGCYRFPQDLPIENDGSVGTEHRWTCLRLLDGGKPHLGLVLCQSSDVVTRWFACVPGLVNVDVDNLKIETQLAQ
jgi:hypothetical protein